MSNMLLRLVIAASLATLVANGLAYYCASSLLLAMGALFALVFVVLGFPCVMRFSSGSGMFNLQNRTPFLVWLLLFVGIFMNSWRLNQWLADLAFRQDFSVYQNVVHEIEAGKLKVTTESQVQVAGPWERVLVLKLNDGTRVVEFFRLGSFPLKHRGYLYCSSDSPQNSPWLTRSWPRLRRIRENWYAFAD